MYVQEFSTRKVAAITGPLCGSEVISARVSRAAEVFNAVLRKWGNRPTGETPYSVIDARYETVPHGGSVVLRAVLVPSGLDAESKRSVLGVGASLSEAEDQ
jgi:transposase-like protein